jgi:hypothetical protein
VGICKFGIELYLSLYNNECVGELVLLCEDLAESPEEPERKKRGRGDGSRRFSQTVLRELHRLVIILEITLQKTRRIHSTL